jgi:hypothetical protein
MEIDDVFTPGVDGDTPDAEILGVHAPHCIAAGARRDRAGRWW